MPLTNSRNYHRTKQEESSSLSRGRGIHQSGEGMMESEYFLTSDRFGFRGGRRCRIRAARARWKAPLALASSPLSVARAAYKESDQSRTKTSADVGSTRINTGFCVSMIRVCKPLCAGSIPARASNFSLIRSSTENPSWPTGLSPSDELQCLLRPRSTSRGRSTMSRLKSHKPSSTLPERVGIAIKPAVPLLYWPLQDQKERS